jgi:sortase A
MSTSDLQDEATTEMARAPVTEVETPPALAAEPVAAAPAPSPPEEERPPAPRATVAAPAPRSLRPSWIHVVAVLGALVAGFLLYLLLITPPLQARSQSHLINQFRTELRTQKTDLLLTAPPSGSPVALLSIPRFHLVQVAVQGISSTDTMLGPGRDPSTVLPGQAGNAALVGRGSTYGRPFAHIGDLRTGDEIDVVTAQGPFRYIVSQVSNTHKLGDPAVTAQMKGNHLTLISAASSFRPSKEWVVVATLAGKAYQASGPLPLPPAGYQPGASSSTGSWGGILLWGELLLTAIAIAWVLYRRRFAPGVTYLLTTPVLIALAYLFYGALATLLPPSL